MKIRFLVSYDGTDFCGWQRQGHTTPTSVQATLEEALAKLLGQKITLFASGRTDAGVHALGQVCHFQVDLPEKRFENWDLCWALRAVLPPSISVKKAWIAPDDFHATISATHKTYKYFIYNSPRSNPFLTRTSAWNRHPMDLAHLQASASFLVGKHDFKSFQTTGTPVPHTVRTIMDAKWEQKSKNIVQFSVTGDGFLKQMVRNLVGTQLWLAKDGRPSADMADIIAAQDRRLAGPSAAPQGLFLWKVYYPSDLDKRCRPL